VILHERCSDGYYRQFPHAHARTRHYVREIFLSVSPTHQPVSGYKILLFEKKSQSSYLYIGTPYPPDDGNGSIEVMMMSVFVYFSYYMILSLFYLSNFFLFPEIRATGERGCTWRKCSRIARMCPKSLVGKGERFTAAHRRISASPYTHHLVHTNLPIGTH